MHQFNKRGHRKTIGTNQNTVNMLFVEEEGNIFLRDGPTIENGADALGEKGNFAGHYFDGGGIGGLTGAYSRKRFVDKDTALERKL